MLQKEFGGSVVRYEPRNKKCRATIYWAVASNKAYECAKALLPYLRIKQEQAKLLIDFVDNKMRPEDAKALSTEELQKRDDYWYKMRCLNVKGKLHLQRLSERTAKADAIV